MHTLGQPPDVPYVGYVLVLSMMLHVFSSCIWSWSLEAREAVEPPASGLVEVVTYGKPRESKS